MKSLLAMLGRNMLLVLIAITVMVIAFGIFRSQPKQTVSAPSVQSQSQAPDPSQLSPGGPLTTFQQIFNFGTVSMAAGKVTHRYSVRNSGSDPIRITKLFTSCMCTEATVIAPGGKAGPFGMEGMGYIPNISVPIPSGEAATIEVVFDPAAHGPAGVGRIDRVVTVRTNVGRPLELGFTAMVKP